MGTSNNPPAGRAWRPLARSLGAAVSRRDLAKLTGLAAATGAFAGFTLEHGFAQSAESTPGASPDRPRGGSVVLAEAADADTLDPHLTLNFTSICAYNNIFDTLVAIAPDRTYEGILAESWEISEDGLEYTFHLRDGIQFHNGEAMNADAVKFSFDRVTDPAAKTTSATFFAAVKETVVVDTLTVKLLLSEPYSPLLTYLSATYFGGAIVPPGAVQEMGEDFGRNPIGTGPWIFKEWLSGERITMVRNENYRNFHSYIENKGAPYLDEMSIAIIPSSETQILAFETDEVQAFQVPPSQVASLQENPDYDVVIPTASTGSQFLTFAMEPIEDGQFGAQWKAPFDDVRVRQAAAYAIDYDTIIDNIFYGLAIRTYGPMLSGLFAYRPDIEEFGYHYDPDKAKALLDEADWVESGDGARERNGEKLNVLLWCANDGGTVPRICQVLQNQLDAVGFKVELEVLEAGAFNASLMDGPANLAFSGRGSPEPDVLRALVTATTGFVTYYQDETYMHLVNEASVVQDLDQRTELYFEAQKKMLADVAWIPLWSQLNTMCVRDAKGFKTIPLSENVYAYEDMYYED